MPRTRSGCWHSWPGSNCARYRGPGLLYVTNPFWLLFGARVSRGAAPFFECFCFLIGSLGFSMVLAVVSTLRIRSVTLRQTGRMARNVPRPRRRVLSWFGTAGVSPGLLDQNPVVWREMHRRGRAGWGRAIWRLYGIVSVIFTALAILFNKDIAPGTCAFMVSVGLLMVSVTSATALAEERAHGSLDLLMTTPLSTRAILLGKWRGSFRAVPRLAILPAIIALFSAVMAGEGLAAVLFATLIAALVTAYGAIITSLGLALATWQPRLDRAVGLSVAAYLAVTVVYPPIALTTLRNLGPADVVFLWVSPFFGMFIPMGWVTWRSNYVSAGGYIAMFIWIVLTSALAYALLQMTIAAFDRLLGRMPVVRTAITDGPWPRFRAIGPPRRLNRLPH